MSFNQRHGFKIVCRDYTPCYGKKDGRVYRVGTRHKLGSAAVLCVRGYHYCTAALNCLAFVPRVADFDAEYRLLRVVDESPPMTRATSPDGYKTAASELYVESEVTDADQRRRLLTGATPCIEGFVLRFVAGVLANDADETADTSAAYTYHEVWAGVYVPSHRRWYRGGELSRSGGGPLTATYWPNGRLKEAAWFDSDNRKRRPHGDDDDGPVFVRYHECGALATESFCDDVGLEHRDGDLPSYVEYDENGTRRLERWSHHGERHRDRANGPAEVRRNENGVVWYEAYFTNGVPRGDGHVPTCIRTTATETTTYYHNACGVEVNRRVVPVGGGGRVGTADKADVAA